MICILYLGGGVVSPRSAQLHLGSGVVVVKRRERIEYCTAGRRFSGLPCYPFTMLNIFFYPQQDCCTLLLERHATHTYSL